jgi:hypothetical protein
MKTQTAQTDKRPSKAERRQAWLDNHYRVCANLARLCGHPNPDGKKISVALWKLEKEAHDSATAQCNGETYNGQPFRSFDDGSWDAFKDSVTARLAKILGSVPPGFRVNADARGYALKISPDTHGETNPAAVELIRAAELHRDWGGNGILSPEVNID